MSKNKLISAVFIRAPLWDKRNKYHHNCMVLNKLWKEVAQECKSTDTVVKSQWKKLRETFSKKLAAIPEKCGDPDDSFTTDWPYFQSLLFLKDQFVPKQSSGKFPSKETGGTLDALDADNNNEEDTRKKVGEVNDDETTDQSYLSVPFLSSLTVESTPSNTSKRKRSQIESIGEGLLKAKQDKLEYLKRKEERRTKREADEDGSFFNSILPHVRELSKKQKLRFRIQVLQLLETSSAAENGS